MGILQIDSESNAHLEPTVLAMQQVVIHEYLDIISQVLLYISYDINYLLLLLIYALKLFEKN